MALSVLIRAGDGLRYAFPWQKGFADLFKTKLRPAVLPPQVAGSGANISLSPLTAAACNRSPRELPAISGQLQLDDDSERRLMKSIDLFCKHFGMVHASQAAATDEAILTNDQANQRRSDRMEDTLGLLYQIQPDELNVKRMTQARGQDLKAAIERDKAKLKDHDACKKVFMWIHHELIRKYIEDDLANTESKSSRRALESAIYIIVGGNGGPI
ncbi:hypothetical protein PG995_014463 [Apiospora arundinis]